MVASRVEIAQRYTDQRDTQTLLEDNECPSLDGQQGSQFHLQRFTGIQKILAPSYPVLEM